jgi:hypothetical protein
MTTKQDFETRFSQMGDDIDDMVADGREDLREERQSLKDTWNRLDTRRAELADKDDSAWEEFKDEMEQGWEAIKRDFDDVKRRFEGE